jgi:branched-chain amino acid transport system substrate-binding protein
MATARHLDLALPMLLPGIKVHTDGTSDGYPIEAMQIERFQGTTFHLVGNVIQASPQ